MTLNINRKQMAINALYKALEDNKAEVRSKSAESLGKLGSAEAVPYLLTRLTDNHLTVRLATIGALGEIGNELAIPQLVNALLAPEPAIRAATADSLGKIGSDKAITYLLQTLADADAGVRATAASALGQIGSLDAIPDLVNALDDLDDTVRFNVVEAIGKIVHEKINTQVPKVETETVPDNPTELAIRTKLRDYTFRNEEEVVDFMKENSFLLDILPQGVKKKIIEYFPEAEEIILEVVTDPDISDESELFVLIATKDEPNTAIEKLGNLKNNWWFAQPSNYREKLSIYLESR